MANNRMWIICTVCWPEITDDLPPENARCLIAKYMPISWGPFPRPGRLFSNMTEFFEEHLHPEVEFPANEGQTFFRLFYQIIPERIEEVK